MEKQNQTLSPLSIFCSYTCADESLHKELKRHLSLLQRQGIITGWYDRQIIPGINSATNIDSHCTMASMILLLVTPDFLACDYIYSIEMQRILERHQTEEARVIAIMLRPADLRNTPFAHLPILPQDGRPVTTWKNRDGAFIDITDGIRRTYSDQKTF